MPFLVDYWPTPKSIASDHNHDTCRRVTILAHDIAEAERLFVQTGIKHVHRIVHDAMLNYQVD
jgi:hypothetical protein